MIDNFDELIARCSARRRRRMIRLSLMITGTILLLVASVSGYLMWLETRQSPPREAPAVSARNTAIAAAPSAPAPEVNATPAPAPAAVPAKQVPETAAMPASEPLRTPAPVRSETDPSPKPAPQAYPAPQGKVFEVSTSSKVPSADPVEAYRNRPGYDTALAVARARYAENDFAEAALWAKKANQLDREGEEAWLLSARAYYAQGRKKEAMGVLELYLNYKDSRAAADLLRTWKTAGE